MARMIKTGLFEDLQKDEISVNREMVQKAYNATNKMIQLFKEKWEMEDLEYQVRKMPINFHSSLL